MLIEEEKVSTCFDIKERCMASDRKAPAADRPPSTAHFLFDSRKVPKKFFWTKTRTVIYSWRTRVLRQVSVLC